MYFQPSLTTASLDREQIGYESMRILEKLMDQEQQAQVPLENLIPVPVTCRESCGCSDQAPLDTHAYLKWKIVNDTSSTVRDLHTADLMAGIEDAGTAGEFFDKVTDIYASRDCDGVYVFIDDRIEINTAGEASFPSGRIDRKHLIFAGSRNTDGQDDERFQRGCREEEVIRKIIEEGHGRVYFFMPLHIRDAGVGYILLINPRFIGGDSLFYVNTQERILSYLRIWYSEHKLKQTLRRLSDIYDRDQLTGVFARTAIEKLSRAYSDWRSEGKTVAVFFADVDQFKKFNDRFGHAKGDQVLIQTASVMKNAISSRQGFTLRFGGDEFVSACPVADCYEAQQFRGDMVQKLAAQDISVSIGFSLSDETNDTLDACIKAADNDMYRIKNGVRHP